MDLIYNENHIYTIEEVRHNRQVWRELLLSGKYKQGQHALYVPTDGRLGIRSIPIAELPVHGAFCCLGVVDHAAALLGAPQALVALTSALGDLPYSVKCMVGLATPGGQMTDRYVFGSGDNADSVPNGLVLQNDTARATFEQIADIVIDEELLPIVLSSEGVTRTVL